MEISLTDLNNGFAIQSYADGLVVINQRTHTQSLIIMPERVIPDWRPRRFEDLADEDFQCLVNLEPEIIVLGTGGKQRFPSPALYASIMDEGIGFEIMDTAAACRTYNILMSEGRRIAAALMMI
jgi:uncharacterized protein